MTLGEKLVVKMEKLRERLNRSGIERTTGLMKNMGAGCGYVKKSMTLFLKEDYVDLKNILKEIQLLIDQIEGEQK